MRSPGGGWSKPFGLGLGEVYWSESHSWLAVDGHGGVTAVWSLGSKVWSRYRTPAGHWESRVLLHHGPWFGGMPLLTTVSTNAAGAAAVTWEWCGVGEPDFGNCVKWVDYRTAAGRWLPPTRLENEGFPGGGGLTTIDRAGTVRRYAFLDRIGAVTLRTFRARTGWSRARRVAPSYSFAADGNGAGDQVLLWQGSHHRLLVRIKRVGHRWTGTLEIVHRVGLWAPPQIDSRGRVTIAFTDRDRGGALTAVTADADGVWSPAVALTPDGEAVKHLGLAGDLVGRLVIAWVPDGGRNASPMVMAATKSPGAAWSEPGRVTGRSTHAVVDVIVAVRSDGAPLVGWRGNRGDEPTSWRRLRVRSARPGV